MFIGHFAPALLAATDRRSPRLGPLFVATMLPDIALFLLLIAGVEHASLMPGATAMNALDLWDVRWTHSLLATLGWAAGFAAAVKLLTRSAVAAWIGAAVVASHWFLDVLVHAPDLTIWGGGVRHGLGLWNHPYVAMPLELALAFTAFAFFLNGTRAVDWRGRWTPVLLGIAAVAFQLADWMTPQPAEAVFAWPIAVSVRALSAYTILAVLASWTGRTRERAPA